MVTTTMQATSPSDEYASTKWALSEILHERIRQREVHLWTAEHDDLHGDEDWAWLIARRAVAMSHRDAARAEDCRRLFVEIAAIAVAALEAIDRRPIPADTEVRTSS